MDWRNCFSGSQIDASRRRILRFEFFTVSLGISNDSASSLSFQWIPNILVSNDFIPNYCFANVVSMGYDISLFIFGNIFSDVVNMSPDF